MRRHSRAAALIAASLWLGACASVISPDRQDLAIVEGWLHPSGWECGTVPREDGDYSFVCDIPITVERVVLGRHNERRIVARYFVDVLDAEEANSYAYTGPSIRRARRAAAILWRRDGRAGSYVLMTFEGRSCVPEWAVAEFGIRVDETARLQRAGYPVCSPANQNEESGH